MKNEKIIVFTPSGDTQKVLISELWVNHFEVICCKTEEQCMDEFKQGKASALFAEVDCGHYAAFSLCTQIKKLNPGFLVIFLVSKGDIASTVRAGKMDLHFVYETPLDREQFISIIKVIRGKRGPNNRDLKILLTNSDRKILSYVFAGKTNKQISKLMKKSVRTIEEHRAVIMAKLDVDNPVDLIERAVYLDLLVNEEDYSLDTQKM
jgi:FixJ family two-component response regulator